MDRTKTEAFAQTCQVGTSLNLTQKVLELHEKHETQTEREWPEESSLLSSIDFFFYMCGEILAEPNFPDLDHKHCVFSTGFWIILIFLMDLGFFKALFFTV